MNRIKRLYPLQWGYRKVTSVLNSFGRKQKVAMFHPGRCGSTVLGEMLNSHSDVFWGGEVFERGLHLYNGKRPDVSVDKTLPWMEQRRVSKIFGFETKYMEHQHLSYKCLDIKLEKYVQLLKKQRYTKFIVLHRKNYLRKLISGFVALNKNKWHTNSGVKGAQAIELDLSYFGYECDLGSALLDYFRRTDSRYEALQEILSHELALNLIYEEDILGDPFVAYEKACNFLGVVVEPAEVSLRRTNPFAYDEMLSNFDEVRKALLGTEYEWMLND